VSASSARDEAERLVAAALAAASVAARGATGFATGSAECCVCPLCRAIAAVRDPDPRLADGLASSAADLAAGLAGMLRAFGGTHKAPPPPDDEHPSATRTTSAAPGAPAPERTTAEGGVQHGPDVWHDATASTAASTGTPPPPRKPMAKKAVKPKLEKADGE
jgi:hypothetical protein